MSDRAFASPVLSAKGGLSPVTELVPKCLRRSAYAVRRRHINNGDSAKGINAAVAGSGMMRGSNSNSMT